jgi:adenylylsulfate kinase
LIERAALLSGTVGAGKTTVGEELSELLKDRGEPHAFIDLDRLSELWPAPEGDPLNERLVLANLAAITRNFAAAGARTLVMSGVVETAERIDKYRLATGGCPLTVVRITASLDSIADRLKKRHEYWDPDGLAWHLDRAPELAAALDASGLGSIVISNDGDPHEAAALLLERLGWLETE